MPHGQSAGYLPFIMNEFSTSGIPSQQVDSGRTSSNVFNTW